MVDRQTGPGIVLIATPASADQRLGNGQSTMQSFFVCNVGRKRYNHLLFGSDIGIPQFMLFMFSPRNCWLNHFLGFSGEIGSVMFCNYPIISHHIPSYPWSVVQAFKLVFIFNPIWHDDPNRADFSAGWLKPSSFPQFLSTKVTDRLQHV